MDTGPQKESDNTRSREEGEREESISRLNSRAG